MLLTRMTPRPAPESALSYALGLGWPVVPGCQQGRKDRRCGREDCLTGPPHPSGEHAPICATRDESTIRRWWLQDPQAPVLLAAGLSFDVLDVPAARAEQALDGMRASGFRLGPILRAADGRLLVWVRAGSRLRTEVQQRRPWPYDGVGLHCLSSGGYVLAPPYGGNAWVEAPAMYGQPVLPHGADVLPAVVAACR